MNDVAPQTLTARQYRAMTRFGQALVPGSEGMPGYREVDAARFAWRALAPARRADREALLVLINLLGVVPAPLLRCFFTLLALWGRLPGWPGAPARLLDIGLRGLVMNTYYAGLDQCGPAGESAVHRAMDFRLQCEPLKETTYDD